MEALLHYMVKLGGPKLLVCAPPHHDVDCSSCSFHEGRDEDAAAAESSSDQAGPSFQSDQWIIRLLIGRYWADHIISQYTEYLSTVAKNPTTESKEKEPEYTNKQIHPPNWFLPQIHPSVYSFQL